MVAKRQCSFCAREIEPGTGTIFVKRDGTVYQFCSSSCRKQQLHLGRIGHRFKWTRAYELKRAAERSTAERGTGAPAASRGLGPAATQDHPAPAPPPAEPPVNPVPEKPVPAAPAPKRPRARSPAKAARKTSVKAAAKPEAKPSSDEG